jgi:hypothetical protein
MSGSLTSAEDALTGRDEMIFRLADAFFPTACSINPERLRALNLLFARIIEVFSN